MKNQGLALVTGGSRGIGAAIAKRLARDGFKVAVHYKSNQAAAESVLTEIKSTGGDGFLTKFEMADSASITAGIEAIIKEHGPISALVNNAGITGDALFIRQPNEQIEQLLKVNLEGSIIATREVVKNMIRAKNGGSVVFISSIVGEHGNSGQAVYAATKAGLIGFAKSVALEVASRNIRSNVVTPGFIATDMTENLTETQKESILRGIPLGRMGTSEEIANAVSFLIGNESRYVTGQVIAVNGGMAT